MRRVVVTFAVNTDAGEHAKFSELVALEIVDGSPVAVLEVNFKDRASVADQLKRLGEFVNDDPVVVLNAALWRKHLRHEFRAVGQRASATMLKRTIDVQAMARQRFPRQRKDVRAIARKLDVVTDEPKGLRDEASLLASIVNELEKPAVGALPTDRKDEANNADEPQTSDAEPFPFGTRLLSCWRGLVVRKSS